MTHHLSELLIRMQEAPAGELISNGALASHLRIPASAVSRLVRELAAEGLAEVVPYYGARLTPTGVREAKHALRRVRVVELFLSEVLGYGWDEVPPIAGRLAEVGSEGLIDRMATRLGNPTRDPHGGLIPDREGGNSFTDAQRLSDMGAGQHALLREITDEDPTLLRYLAELGLMPGRRFEILAKVPFDDALQLSVDGRQTIIPGSVVSTIRAVAISPTSPPR